MLRGFGRIGRGYGDGSTVFGRLKLGIELVEGSGSWSLRWRVGLIRSGGVGNAEAQCSKADTRGMTARKASAITINRAGTGDECQSASSTRTTCSSPSISRSLTSMILFARGGDGAADETGFDGEFAVAASMRTSSCTPWGGLDRREHRAQRGWFVRW